MARLNPIETTQADPKAKSLLEGVNKKLGMTPNIMSTMANSPAVLGGYLGFSNALGGGSLPAKLREQIALTVGELNACGYCVSAHAALGRLAGLSEEEINDSRRGVATDSKTEAAVQFARKIVTERGHVSDADLDAVRSAGFRDGEIAEIVANVALNIFTNYFNHVAETESDFPAVSPIESGPTCACG